MKVVVFCHSLVSDWNHGNAHFLRGITAELLARGHGVDVHEPLDGWSRSNLVAADGRQAVDEFRAAFPTLRSRCYDPAEVDVDALVEGADLVLVHEWNDPALVAALGRAGRRGGHAVLFHDTHHRAVSRPEEMARYDLSHYDGVLAFGSVIRDIYLDRAGARRAWTWHEAADGRTFGPRPAVPPAADLVWIGNWGDGERTRERLEEFLFEPVTRLGLRATVHGVRYPEAAKARLAAAGVAYGGWVPNHRVPDVFAAHRVTLHVPRRPYVEALPGIPTIRVFEALACGIPLVSAPWDDCEGLFRPGTDFLVARDGRAVDRALADVLGDAELAAALARSGAETIAARHTCSHRVDELLAIATELGVTTEVAA